MDARSIVKYRSMKDLGEAHVQQWGKKMMIVVMLEVRRMMINVIHESEEGQPITGTQTFQAGTFKPL